MALHRVWCLCDSEYSVLWYEMYDAGQAERVDGGRARLHQGFGCPQIVSWADKKLPEFNFLGAPGNRVGTQNLMGCTSHSAQFSGLHQSFNHSAEMALWRGRARPRPAQHTASVRATRRGFGPHTYKSPQVVTLCFRGDRNVDTLETEPLGDLGRETISREISCIPHAASCWYFSLEKWWPDSRALDFNFEGHLEVETRRAFRILDPDFELL